MPWDVYNALPFEEITEQANDLRIRTMRSDDRVVRTEGCHVPEHSYPRRRYCYVFQA